MKTLFKKVNTFIIILSIFSLSCTNLKEELFDEVSQENYYQNADNVVAAVIRCYEHNHWCFWDGGGDRVLAQELTGDLISRAQKGKHHYDDGNHIRFQQHKWLANDGYCYGSWLGLYQGITQNNLIIEDLSRLNFTSLGLTDADKDRYIGEMRILRANYYIWLLDFFRNVPIVTKVGEDITTQHTPQEVFAFIETELKETLPCLAKKGDAAYIKGRVNQAYVAGLLVKLYMNAGVWINQEKYAEAITYADNIINGLYGSYSIDPDYRGPFKGGVNGYESPELILEFPHKDNQLEFPFFVGWNHYTANKSQGHDDGGAWNAMTLAPSRDLYGNKLPGSLGKPFELFDPLDKRRALPFQTTDISGNYEGFFMYGIQYFFDDANKFGHDLTKFIEAGEEYKGKHLVYVDQMGRYSEDMPSDITQANSILDAAGSVGGATAYFTNPGPKALAGGTNLSKGEENSGIRLAKYPWLPLASGNFQANSAPEMRLAEIIFSKAEAEWRLNSTDGATLIDPIRNRNFTLGGNPYGPLTNEDQWLAEYGREFLAERRRRLDLIRFGKFGDAWWGKEADANNLEKAVFPIPERAINASRGVLKQTTPGF